MEIFWALLSMLDFLMKCDLIENARTGLFGVDSIQIYACEFYAIHAPVM